MNKYYIPPNHPWLLEIYTKEEYPQMTFGRFQAETFSFERVLTYEELRILEYAKKQTENTVE